MPDPPLFKVLCNAEDAWIDDVSAPNDAAVGNWKDTLEWINESGIYDVERAARKLRVPPRNSQVAR